MTNISLAAVIAFKVHDLSNSHLAVANTCMQGWGRCDKTRDAYNALRSLDLVNEEGYSSEKDELISALSLEVTRRVEAGTFD